MIFFLKKLYIFEKKIKNRINPVYFLKIFLNFANNESSLPIS